jgi:Tfp pilus assembly protein PilF
MNRLSVLLAALLVAGVLTTSAQSPEDQYVRIYNLIQQADALNSKGQFTQALPKYLEAQSALQRIQKVSPEWNPKVVNFRLNYLAEKIDAVPGANSLVPATKPAPAPVAPAPALPVPKLEAQPATPPATSPATVELQNDVARLQAEKAILEAKLKEALATQPAAIDARELTKAQEKIQSLLKENELLKTSLEAEKGKPKTAAESREIEELKTALAESNRKLADQFARANTLLTEQQALQKRFDSLATDPSELAGLKQSLAEANRKLAEQTTAAEKSTSEKASLQERINQLTASAASAEALRAENTILKQQLAQTKSTEGDAADETKRRTAEAEARIAALQSDAQILRLEKLALEDRLKKNLAASPINTVAGSRRDADAQRIRQLEQERGDLQQRLAAATNQAPARSSKELVAKVDQLTKEVTSLRARVDVFEARAIPYTAEELALFQAGKPKVVTVDPNAGRKSIRALPAGSAALVAEAQRNFASKDYEKAEQNYLDILRQDEKNPNTLANLATIQMEMGHLDEADKNIQLALTTAPDDGYNLAMLGFVKYRQEKYDEALDALSRAAKIIPQSAEIQNYLGVTLSHKGLRGPAETALRKSIQIDPNYGSAHNNLAVIYATQTPPLIELARWHYQKALAAGHPKNEELEKLFDKKEAPAK